MKKFLLVLVGTIFSVHCAAQGRITDFQRILGTSDHASLEVELNLNKAKTILNTTMLEKVFGHGLNHTQFSLFEKNQDLFSPSIEFLNIGLPDFRIFTGNVELFDQRDFGKPGITGYQGNIKLLNLPTRFGGFIADDETAHKGYIDMHLPPMFFLRDPSCRCADALACSCNPFSPFDHGSRRKRSVGEIVVLSVASLMYEIIRQAAWSSDSRYYRPRHCRGF